MCHAIERAAGADFSDTPNAPAVRELMDRISDEAFDLGDADPLAPLLEQERHASAGALVPKVAEGLRVGRPRLVGALVGLAAGDDPRSAPKREKVNGQTH